MSVKEYMKAIMKKEVEKSGIAGYILSENGSQNPGKKSHEKTNLKLNVFT